MVEARRIRHSRLANRSTSSRSTADRAIVVGYNGCFECLVVFGIFQRANHVSAVSPLRTAFRRERSLPSSVIGPVLWRALRRFASICLNVVIDYQPQCSFRRNNYDCLSEFRTLTQAIGSCCASLPGFGASGAARAGCDCAQSADAVSIGSTLTCCHQTRSSPHRCSSRRWVRQSGTANSSLTLRPRARPCANLRWCASDGRRPQLRHGCAHELYMISVAPALVLVQLNC